MKDVKVDERRGQGFLTCPIVCRCDGRLGIWQMKPMKCPLIPLPVTNGIKLQGRSTNPLSIFNKKFIKLAFLWYVINIKCDLMTSGHEVNVTKRFFNFLHGNVLWLDLNRCYCVSAAMQPLESVAAITDNVSIVSILKGCCVKVLKTGCQTQERHQNKTCATSKSENQRQNKPLEFHTKLQSCAK